MKEWHDKFFAGIYAQVLAKQFDQATDRRQAKGIKKLLRLRRGRSVLDLPCGQGRITLQLARLGLKATGIDRQPSYIRRARSAAKRARLRVDYRVGDMRNLDFRNEFDGVFNWYGSFGYFPDRQNETVLRNSYEALKPGGRFLLDCPNKDWIRQNFKKRMEAVIGGVRIVQINRWLKGSQRTQTDWTFKRGGRTERYRSLMKQYNVGDLKKLFKKTRFKQVRFYSDPSGKPVGKNSFRIISVARRTK